MADDSTVKRRKRNEERRKQQSKDSKKPSSDDRTNEYKDYALVDPGKIEPGPDVLIDVPVVKVDKLEIEVDDLRALVAVQAKVRKLLDLDGAISVAFSPKGEEMFVATHFTGLVEGFAVGPEDTVASTPNLVAWLGRMNERACMKQTTWERVAQMAAATAQAA